MVEVLGRNYANGVIRVRAGEPKIKALPAIRQGSFISYWVYILYSDVSGRYYCGQSTNVEQRIRQHNDPNYRLMVSKHDRYFLGSELRSFELEPD